MSYASSAAPGQVAAVGDDASANATRALLTCGVVAGPVWIAVAFAQVFTRSGFDITRHPISVLSNGDLGWIQIANFVVTGLLCIASAVGLRRVLRPGRGGVWAPRLVGAYGVGLFAAGPFVADPTDGFPAGTPLGTPLGTPTTFSWHSILHGVAAMVAFVSVVAACFVFARRYAGQGRRGVAEYCIATGVVTLPLAAPLQAGIGVRLAVAAVLWWAWLATMLILEMTALSERRH